MIAVLATTNARVEEALRTELAKPIRLETGRFLQFEVDPCFFGVSLCAAEATILPSLWLGESLPPDWFDRAEESLGGWNGIIEEELCPWFGARWQAVGGPRFYSPAFMFFHDYHRNQYDLERRCWLPASEVFRQRGPGQ